MDGILNKLDINLEYWVKTYIQQYCNEILSQYYIVGGRNQIDVCNLSWHESISFYEYWWERNPIVVIIYTITG